MCREEADAGPLGNIWKEQMEIRDPEMGVTRNKEDKEQTAREMSIPETREAESRKGQAVKGVPSPFDNWCSKVILAKAAPGGSGGRSHNTDRKGMNGEGTSTWMLLSLEA